MNISLPPEWEQFISQEIRGGNYHSVDDVLCAGLLRLKQDREMRLAELPDTLEELEAQLLERIRDVENGHAIDGEESLARMRRRTAVQRPNG